MKILTNATKREPTHRIDVSVKQMKDFILPRFGYMSDRTFKYIKAYHIKPGLTLHYKKYDGVVKLGFEEKGFGVSEVWYTKEVLTKAADYEKAVKQPIEVYEDIYSIQEL